MESYDDEEEMKLNTSNSNWEADLIPDELSPSARTLYLIYVMCKKYKDLNRDMLKDMWCDGDLKLMDAVTEIERGRVDRCYEMLKQFANEKALKSGGQIVQKEFSSVRKILGLSNKQMKDVVKFLRLESSDRNGTFDRKELRHSLSMISSDQDENEKRRLIDRLFDSLLFDRSSNNKVSVRDVCIAMNMFCRGSADEKAAMTFEIFDANNDGVVSASEMQTFLHVAFSVLSEFVPSYRDHDLSVNELVRATTDRADPWFTEALFQDADKDHDGKITLSEFRVWFPRCPIGSLCDDKE